MPVTHSKASADIRKEHKPEGSETSSVFRARAKTAIEQMAAAGGSEAEQFLAMSIGKYARDLFAVWDSEIATSEPATDLQTWACGLLAEHTYEGVDSLHAVESQVRAHRAVGPSEL